MIKTSKSLIYKLFLLILLFHYQLINEILELTIKWLR